MHNNLVEFNKRKKEWDKKEKIMEEYKKEVEEFRAFKNGRIWKALSQYRRLKTKIKK